MMLPQIIKYKSSEYYEMLALRKKILREPLNLSFTEDDIDNEINDVFLTLSDPRGSDNFNIIACCILTPIDEEVVKLRQMAVDVNWQGEGIGRQMVEFAELVAKERGFRKIIMHARQSALDFYRKLGYNVIDNEFIEVNIPHYKMEKTIQLNKKRL